MTWIRYEYTYEPVTGRTNDITNEGSTSTFGMTCTQAYIYIYIYIYIYTHIPLRLKIDFSLCCMLRGNCCPLSNVYTDWCGLQHPASHYFDSSCYSYLCSNFLVCDDDAFSGPSSAWWPDDRGEVTLHAIDSLWCEDAGATAPTDQTRLLPCLLYHTPGRGMGEIRTVQPDHGCPVQGYVAFAPLRPHERRAAV